MSQKIALVTGAMGGLGTAVCQSLAKDGMKVVANCLPDFDQKEGWLAAQRELGFDFVAAEGDVSNYESCAAMVAQIEAEAGAIDILVNNSVARPMRNGYQSDASTFAQSMAVNATGLFVITRAFGDVMAENGRGSIINVGSIQGLIAPDPTIYRGTTMSGWAPDYFFHKGGMVNFTRFIGSYYGLKNVRCNCIAPGGYQTPDHPEAFVRQYSDKTFLGRLAGDTDLKGIIVFLASDASAYITGTTIPVDAGYTAK